MSFISFKNSDKTVLHVTGEKSEARKGGRRRIQIQLQLTRLQILCSHPLLLPPCIIRERYKKDTERAKSASAEGTF